MNILIIGHEQHGKGTLSKYAKEKFGLDCMGTSQYNAERIFNLMKDTHDYKDVEECYLNRDENRKFWFDEINNYCKVNYARVIEEILVNHDICEGVRNRIEFDCAKKKQVFDFVIWVDASERMPLENPESMELSEDDADLILRNNTTEADFEVRCISVLKMLLKMQKT